jgi:NAD(P)H-hydrate epimerase
MLPLLTRAEARAVDRDAETRLGLPTLALMENAGAGAARVLCDAMPDRLGRVVVVGGTGQNGGDGWVLARHLVTAGLPAPTCFVVGDPERITGDARVNFGTLAHLGIAPTPITEATGLGPLEAALGRATVLVDGVFGTGLDRPVAGVAAAALGAMAASSVPILALDLPSGIDSDTGAILAVAAPAALTVTFGAHKRGLWQHPGATYAGEVRLVHLGVPVSPSRGAAVLLVSDDLGSLVRPRPRDAHKGTAGHVLVIAGRGGTAGAASLAGLAALRGGAGLCTVVTRPCARRAVEAGTPQECMLSTLPEAEDDAVAHVLALAEGKRAAVLGPGLGTYDALAARLAVALPLPAVVDADALGRLAVVDGGGLEALRGAAAPRVLTPHPGEAARLLGLTAAAVQRDRHAAATAIAARSGQVCVLKGAGTVVAHPNGRQAVVGAGTPALAVAGTGDVLAGLVGAALCAHPATLDGAFDAACAAALLHALAGERVAHGGDRGLLAHEVADAAPAVLAAALGATCRIRATASPLTR